jgi:hypothetical protein
MDRPARPFILVEIYLSGKAAILQSGKGAIAWSIQDINHFKAHHQPGTMAHLCLTVLAFTACRIGDARLLGRHNEVMRGGVRYLEWQPEKKMPPLSLSR